MRKAINLVGQDFGNWKVLSRAGSKNGQAMWLCVCGCGIRRVVEGASLRRGDTKSCGCLHEELMSHLKGTHGLSNTNTYTTWKSMNARCSNPHNKNFKHYGLRGIIVCERWLKFENFYKDMGPRPKGLTIERIDNNKGYNPENCKWATMQEQNRNSRNCQMITYRGQTKCVAEWAEEKGIAVWTLRSRLKKYSPETALTLNLYERG